ncbi:hypothetical protein [Neochlamydia sp. S13]|uniref:hypothetical protein n=1 Tax=Neochlamydia sp. S13 TaxID=1353976 RepID=UPI0005A9875A|nr:hypothetical protein [Neochlamydia sp. S13]BBI17663.1 Uncharacterized protein NCS13_1_1468 [Neochlamydia sp. S13]
MCKTLFKNTRNKFLNKWVRVLLISLGLFGLTRLYFKMTDDFRLSNISYNMPYRHEWEVPSLPKEEQQQLDNILDQKFYYVGKGAQSYAFKSADDKYILKFFKFKHLKPSVFISLIPPIGPLKVYKDKQRERKHRLLNSVFDGYRLAYNIHAHESGLIYIHLNKSVNLHKIVAVKDKIGIERQVDLDQVPFILQEKANTTRAEMMTLMGAQDMSGVKKRIQQIFDLYLLEYNKGIYDRDHGVMHNTGFVQDRAIHLDVGKLTKDERMKNSAYSQPDFLQVVHKLNAWFKLNYPEYHSTINVYMEQQMQKMFEEIPVR